VLHLRARGDLVAAEWIVVVGRGRRPVLPATAVAYGDGA
jgi:hypothetical protein